MSEIERVQSAELIHQTQGFRGTVCAVRAKESLSRLLNAQSSVRIKP